MRLLITAGPTREPIDAVRFISNRSSGRMGFALCHAAIQSGHKVTLLLGPGPDIPNELSQSIPDIHRFDSTTDLKQQMDQYFPHHDVLILAAAVADYRPSVIADGKRPRDEHKNSPTDLLIHLQPTPDLVASIATTKRPDQSVIAFALENNEQLEVHAVAKMRRKGVDAIVANPLTTMESDDINPIWFDIHTSSDSHMPPDPPAPPAIHRDSPGIMSKRKFAHWLIRKIETLHTQC